MQRLLRCGPQFLEVDLAQWLNSRPIKLFVPPKEAIKITLYRWVEWGGVGVARAHFRHNLQKFLRIWSFAEYLSKHP